MSPSSKRITWALALLGLAGTAIFGAIAVSGTSWAIPLLWTAGALFCAASAVVFLWPTVKRAIFVIADRLEQSESPGGEGYKGIQFAIEPRIIQGMDIWISAIALGGDGKIENREFRDCRILGPGILALTDQHSSFHECDRLNEPFDQVVWPTSGKVPAGCIWLHSCTFYRCTFENVGFAVPEDGLEEWRGFFAESTPPADTPPTTAGD